MKNIKILPVILCLTLGLGIIGPVYAQAIEVSDSFEKQMAREIELKIELSRLVIESGERIDSEINKAFKPGENPFDNQAKLAHIVNSEAKSFEQFYEKALKIPEEKVSLFRKIYSQISWDNVIPLMKKAHIGAEIFFKKKGYGIGIAIMMSKTTKFTLLSSLVKFGLGAYSPVVMFIPWSPLYSMIPKLIEKHKIHKSVVEALGSKEKVEAFSKQEQAMLAELNMKSPDDLILPIRELADGKMENVILRDNPIWKKMLAYLNFNTDDLNIITLKDFIRESRMNSPYVDWLLKRHGLDNDQRMVLIITHIFSSGSEEVQLKFRNEFSHHFVIAKSNPSWGKILEWSRKMRDKKSMEEVMEETRNIPKDLKPKEIALVWENILLPEYVKSLDLDHGEARTMLLHFEAFKARLYTMEDVNQDKLQHEMFSFLEKILQGRHFNGCKKNPKEVEAYLINRVGMN